MTQEAEVLAVEDEGEDGFWRRCWDCGGDGAMERSGQRRNIFLRGGPSWQLTMTGGRSNAP